jgi:hypothetical protein
MISLPNICPRKESDFYLIQSLYLILILVDA